MTRPRLLKPGQTYMITRRCSQREYLLTPGKRVDCIILYCLARAATIFEVKIHAFMVMSNHYHLILTDSTKKVCLPKFMAWFNLHLARALNKHHKRREYFWAPGSYSAVLLADEASVLDKIVYTVTNAVTANLVEEPQDWPGLCSQPNQLGGQEFQAEKPDFFFGDASPEWASFQLSIPGCFEHLGQDRFCELVTRIVKERVEECRLSRLASGAPVLGEEAIKAQDPVVACQDVEMRIALLQVFKAFWSDYREAWGLWKKGHHRVCFPAGTYLMRRLHRARCPT